MKPVLVAGLGSRNIERRAYGDVVSLAGFVKSIGGWVRTCGDWGCCDAWSRGAEERAIVYRPRREESERSYRPSRVVYLEGMSESVQYKAFDSIKKLHPADGQLGHEAKLDLATRYLAVMGAASRPVDILVVCAPERYGVVLGDTRHAVNVAEDHGIPVVNMMSASVEACREMIRQARERAEAK